MGLHLLSCNLHFSMLFFHLFIVAALILLVVAFITIEQPRLRWIFFFAYLAMLIAALVVVIRIKNQRPVFPPSPTPVTKEWVA